MAQKLDQDVSALDQVFEAISERQSFLLSGGAGSGKTHSLVEALQRIYTSDPDARVACITFTHVAANEIRERAPFAGLRVSTIHEFVWSLISPYQRDLKRSLLELIQSDEIKSQDKSEFSEATWLDPIQYREWLSLSKGIISHDEVLQLTEKLFSTHPILSKILNDSWDFLFIDEYQDTPPRIMRTLLETIWAHHDGELVLGLFGDRAQAIHEEDKNDEVLQVAKSSGLLREIVKAENRRNAAAILIVANYVRDDGLLQEMSTDPSAPNFGKVGSALFLFSRGDALKFSQLKQLPYFNEWEDSPGGTTKLLFLGKSSIAEEAGFPTLMKIYKGDKILEFGKRVRDDLRKKDLDSAQEGTFGDAVLASGVEPTSGQSTFLGEHADLYAKALQFPYREIADLYISDDQLIGTKKTSDFDDRNRGEKRDALISHLFQIQECLYLYRNRLFNDFLTKTDYRVRAVQDKRDLKSSMDTLGAMDGRPIEEVIAFAHEAGIRRIDDTLEQFIAQRRYVYDRVKAVQFEEVVNLFNYTEDFTPYSTQAGIKGAEFQNVFVSLDNGGWNNYSFEALFNGKTSKPSVVARTRMMFYVSCTRAMDRLIVYFVEPNGLVLEQARKWFGADSVAEVSV